MKDVFEMLNEVVMDPADCENSEELSYFERMRIKNRIKTKLGKRKTSPATTAIVAICASVLLYTGIPTDVKAAFYSMASNIPIVRGMLDLFVGQPAQQTAEYKTAIGQVVIMA